jgi:hypothetical protein
MTDEYTYDSWKEDLLKTCISIHYCPQCGLKLKIDDNCYFPDRSTYFCKRCLITFTQITPGEIIITNYK